MKNNIGLYQNGQWVTTIATDKIVYEKDLVLQVSRTGGAITLSDIKVSDLGDWREAIYIDMETDGMSAISSVIQERPIEMVAKSDGSLDIWYEPNRDTIEAIRRPKVHDYTYSIPSDGASDAIINGPEEVKTMRNAGFARELGFATRVMRMPDLDTGAMRAAYIILQRKLESFHRHSITTRPDLALEVGDIYSFSYIASGTERIETRDIIVESISLDFSMLRKINSNMTISGREVYNE
jgi:hypothetical protein